MALNSVKSGPFSKLQEALKREHESGTASENDRKDEIKGEAKSSKKRRSNETEKAVVKKKA